MKEAVYAVGLLMRKPLLYAGHKQIRSLSCEPIVFVGTDRPKRDNSRLAFGGIWICNQFCSLLQLQCEIIRSQFVELVLGCLKALLSRETSPYRKSNSNNSEKEKREVSRQFGPESSFIQTGLGVVYPTIKLNEPEPHSYQTKCKGKCNQNSIEWDIWFVYWHIPLVSRTAGKNECHNHESLAICNKLVAA